MMKNGVYLIVIVTRLVTLQGGHEMMQKFPANLLQLTGKSF